MAANIPGVFLSFMMGFRLDDDDEATLDQE
jgi:hypothetical protein